MAAYLKKAEQANKVIKSIMDALNGVPEIEHEKDFILSQALYLYNLGIRTAPRPTQSTVRLRAVEAAASGFPGTTVRMVTKTGKGFRGEYTYNAISIQVKRTDPVEDGDTDTE
jgi:hypothetical protein